MIGAIIGTATGIAGTVLGVLNYLHDRRQSATRLRTRILFATDTPDGWIFGEEWLLDSVLAVKVVNDSSFEVPIVDVGLIVKDKSNAVVSAKEHDLIDQCELPKTLKPKESAAFGFADLTVAGGNAWRKQIKCTYVKTAGDDVFYSKGRTIELLNVAGASSRSSKRERP